MEKIVVTPRGFAKYGTDNIKKMEKFGFAVKYNDTGLAYTKEQFASVTNDAMGLIVGVEQVDREFIDSHPKLKAVVKFGVGTDNIDKAVCKERGIFVGRTTGSNSRTVAETVLSYLLMDSKNMWDAIAQTRQGGWKKNTGYELNERVLGIIGFGSIGKLVAKLASGIGMRVICYDACPVDPKALSECGAKLVSKDELLEKSDAVTLHVPLTAQTENCIRLEEIKKMKPHAILINTSRGRVVNESDLYIALRDHVIRAAYFDVFSSEPPEKNEPLLTLPNFYLSPHIASRSEEAEKRTADIATQVLLDALCQKKGNIV